MFSLAPLFDLLPNAYLFIKDREGRFLKGNQALLKLMGAGDESEIIGKTDYDFFPRDLAYEYREEDLQVMETRTPVINRPWLVCNVSGELDWFVSTKIPLLGQPASPRSQGEVMGIAGLMRDIQEAGKALKPYQEMQEVLNRIFTNYQAPIRNRELAKIVHLSVSQFDRKFKELFRVSPQRFIQAVRVRMAKRLLVSSDMPLAAIAAKTGFYDQSSFGKQFRRLTGFLPKDYRRTFKSQPMSRQDADKLEFHQLDLRQEPGGFNS